MRTITVEVGVEEIKEGVKKNIMYDKIVAVLFVISGVVIAITGNAILGLILALLSTPFIYDMIKLNDLLEKIESEEFKLEFSGVATAFEDSICVKFKL